MVEIGQKIWKLVQTDRQMMDRQADSSSAVYRGFEPCLGQTNDHKMRICCNFAKQEDLRSKNWPIQNQDNVSEWNDISTGGLLVQ